MIYLFALNPTLVLLSSHCFVVLSPLHTSWLLSLEAGRSDFKYDFTPKEVRVGKASLGSRKEGIPQVKH